MPSFEQAYSTSAASSASCGERTIGFLKLQNGHFLEFDRGEVFGEVAFFLGVRTADVVVASDTARVLALSSSVMNKLLDSEPRIAARLAMNLGRVLSSRLTGHDMQNGQEDGE